VISDIIDGLINIFASRCVLGFNSVEEAIEDIRLGRIVIVADDEDRENEGDLTIAASKVTPEVKSTSWPGMDAG
jgi:hypothetical protein